HRRDHDPMPRLVGFGRLIWPHLDAPGVGTDRRQLLFLAPVAVFEFDTRRIAAGVAAPFLLRQTALHLAGAHNDEIAAADGHILLLGTFIQFVVGNAFAVLHPFDATESRDIEQDATADHLVLGVLN